MTDALGNLVRFLLLPGHRYDTVGVAPLISDLEFDALVADKAFDANWIIDELNERGAKIVISQRPQRVAPLAIDEEMYKWRHLVENFLQTQRVQADRDARRQNRSELRGLDLPLLGRHQLTMNLNRP